jgi:hypothetical protein
MRSLAGILAVIAIVAACAPSPPQASAPLATPTENAALASCQADIVHANLNVHDVTALDFAIHDCPSLAALKAALAADPGYMAPGVSVEDFVRNRCDDPNATFAGLDNPICDEVPPLQ